MGFPTISRLAPIAALVGATACGSVSTVHPDASGTGGSAGKGGASGSGGTSGRGGNDSGGTTGTGGGGTTGAGGASGTMGKGGATGTAGAGGGNVDAGCLSTNAAGFAWNISNPCPRDAAPACYAACTLNGAQYVGCVSGSTIGTECYRACSDCP